MKEPGPSFGPLLLRL